MAIIPNTKTKTISAIVRTLILTAALFVIMNANNITNFTKSGMALVILFTIILIWVKWFNFRKNCPTTKSI